MSTLLQRLRGSDTNLLQLVILTVLIFAGMLPTNLWLSFQADRRREGAFVGER